MGTSCCKNNSSVTPSIQKRYYLDHDFVEFEEIKKIEQERKKENEEFEKNILNREQNEKKMQDQEQNNNSDKCYCYSCKNSSNQTNTNTTLPRSLPQANNNECDCCFDPAGFCCICQVIFDNPLIDCGNIHCIGCDFFICPC